MTVFKHTHEMETVSYSISAYLLKEQQFIFKSKIARSETLYMTWFYLFWLLDYDDLSDRFSSDINVRVTISQTNIYF